jgi:integrase
LDLIWGEISQILGRNLKTRCNTSLHPQKELQVSNIKLGAVERNIYCEKRRSALRFVVQVSPLPKATATVELHEFDAGLAWARQKRVDLLAAKKTKSVAVCMTTHSKSVAAFVPGDILIQDILDNYRKHQLAKLAGATSEGSRLKKLEQWFGHLKLGQLPPSFIEDWQSKRLAGLLGSGRVRKADLTKHQRYYRKSCSASVKGLRAPEQITRVSPQTVRHELVLLRRTITAYFREKQLNHMHGAWLQSLAIMTMPLPERPAPRDIRLADEPLTNVLHELDNLDHECYVLMAIATTLRRSEVCSLLWEDVDFVRNEVRLREPGHYEKSKVNPRLVPLMPVAVAVLQKLGPKKSGRIFTMTPGGYSQAWRRAADRAGHPCVRLHDMRREGISRLIEVVGAQLELVIAFSGHSDLGVLQRHYAKPRADVIVSTLSKRTGADQLLLPAAISLA